LMRIRDGNNSDPGWKKLGSGIRDKHPGSATPIARRQDFRCILPYSQLRQAG
jgi:hypothetical protein